MNHWEITVKELINALLDEYRPTLATLPTTYLALDKLLEPPARHAKTISNDFLLYRKDCNARLKSTQRIVHQIDLSTMVQNLWNNEKHEVKGLFKILAGILLQATQNARAKFEREETLRRPKREELEREEVLRRPKRRRKSMKPWETSTRIPSMFVSPILHNEHKFSNAQDKGEDANNNKDNNVSNLIITKQVEPPQIEIQQNGNTCISTSPIVFNYFLDSNFDVMQNDISTNYQAQDETIENSTFITDTNTFMPQLGIEYNLQNNEHFHMQASFIDFQHYQTNDYFQDWNIQNNGNVLYDTMPDSENMYVLPSGRLSNIMYQWSLNNDNTDDDNTKHNQQ
ncbi:1676_t:CDS:1 [Ambispora leptoticha]|uniref:1676_t:CDS:1 n=1 Tax=Ambispora leptoticha TaxID=144679 RepID=A0A9N8VC99_9GLOM|nr:1676_t:CDS:1 [Ambispora leptoticha]